MTLHPVQAVVAGTIQTCIREGTSVRISDCTLTGVVSVPQSKCRESTSISLRMLTSKSYQALRINGFSGLCPSSAILKTREHNVSETASVSVLRSGGETTCWDL
jgi:hypothetical protein